MATAKRAWSALRTAGTPPQIQNFVFMTTNFHEKMIYLKWPKTKKTPTVSENRKWGAPMKYLMYFFYFLKGDGCQNRYILCWVFLWWFINLYNSIVSPPRGYILTHTLQKIRSDKFYFCSSLSTTGKPKNRIEKQFQTQSKFLALWKRSKTDSRFMPLWLWACSCSSKRQV